MQAHVVDTFTSIFVVDEMRGRIDVLSAERVLRKLCGLVLLLHLAVTLYLLVVLQCLLSILSLPLYIFDCKIKMQLNNSVTLSAVRSLDWQGHN